MANKDGAMIDRKNNDHTVKILFYIGLFCVIAFLVWFFYSHEKVVSDTRYRPNATAKESPFSAANLLLTTQGKQVTVLTQETSSLKLKQLWQDTKNAKGKLVILTHMDTPQASHLEGIIRWVQAGGHLVVYSNDQYEHETGVFDTANDDWQNYTRKENPLLIKLGIYAESDSIEVNNDFNTYLVPLRLPDGQLLIVDDPVAGKLNASRFLSMHPEAVARDYQAVRYDKTRGEGVIDRTHLSESFSELDIGQASKLLVFLEESQKNYNSYQPERLIFDSDYGQGRLTVLTHQALWVNPLPMGFEPEASKKETEQASRLWRYLRGNLFFGVDYQGGISTADHAYLLSHLSQDATEVWLVPRLKSENFISTLWEHLPFFMGALLVFVLGMGLSLPRKFTPVREVVSDESENLLAYFEYVGQYLWASDQVEALMRTNRERLFEKIHLKYPSLNTASKPSPEHSHAIAQMLTLPVSVVENALFGTWQSQSEFLMVCQDFMRVFGQLR
ncbi:MAG: hypothetical protein Q4B88_00780 [Moraxella sp.]|nr:hypothetical protein [Moraxella sp.]